MDLTILKIFSCKAIITGTSLKSMHEHNAMDLQKIKYPLYCCLRSLG